MVEDIGNIGKSGIFKHRLYTQHYEIDKNGAVILPDNCKWKAMKVKQHISMTQGESWPVDIMLQLYEELGDRKGFQSVISWLTPEEALELSEQLRKAAESLKS